VCCYTYLISCLSLWLECPKFQDCALYIPDLMFVIVAGMSKVPELCVIHTWSHVCHRGWNVVIHTWSHVCHCDWNVQSSRIVCYTYLISCLSLWLECPKFQDCVLLFQLQLIQTIYQLKRPNESETTLFTFVEGILTVK
jgi:hypothetical protein